MQYIITKQIAVEAENPEEAVAKLSDGNTISLSVSPRPQPQQAQASARVPVSMPMIPVHNVPIPPK